MIERIAGQSFDNRETDRHNLPAQLTTLIGREHEILEVCALLQRPDVRLITLTGTGGVGKTRLGLQVAYELLDVFDDGVFFVSLSPINNPYLVIPTIAEVLGIREIGDRVLLDLLKAFLQNKCLLLLLDNFEQVLAAAMQVADLVTACPQLKVLVTSRAVLHVRGEQEFAVPPLAVPDPKRLPDLVALSQYEAVALFLQRVRAVKHEFQMTNANYQTIAEICVRLDGLPLAIELAAARIKLLPPQALLTRLEHRLQVLTGGARDVPERQKTLRKTIAWSYDLLSSEEQRLFRRLTVFVGGCTLEAIQAVYFALDGEGTDVLEGVALLLDNSLIQRRFHEEEEPLLFMLETIREYGLECLDASGEMEPMRRAHAEYYLVLSEKAKPQFTGPQQTAWLQRSERELDNFRAALNWLLEREETEMALRIAIAMGRFWLLYLHWSEGRTFLERTLARTQGEVTLLRADAFELLGLLVQNQGDLDRAELSYRESLALYKEFGDTKFIANTLNGLGIIAMLRGTYAAANALFEEGIAISKAARHRFESAAMLSNWAQVALYQGEYVRAHTLAEESLALFKEADDKNGICPSLTLLGRVAAAQGNQVAARKYSEQSIQLARERGFTWEIACGLESLASVVVAQKDPMWAARLWGAAEALREGIGSPLAPVFRSAYEREVATACTQLGKQEFAIAWAKGRTMTLEQVLAAPRQAEITTPYSAGQPFMTTVKQSPIYRGGLTAREVDVLRLVAQGLTNAQIAERLIISPRTVNTHLNSIFGKIQVSTRSAATRYAIVHQLV